MSPIRVAEIRFLRLERVALILDQPCCWIQAVTEALKAWCGKQKVSVLDGEFDLIYVNGDHHLENLRREDQTWKVRLTDEEFPKLMWEGCE
jgi:hypothetical protein